MSMDTPDVRFIINPSFELAAAMYVFSNADKNQSLSKEMKVVPDEMLFKIGQAGEKVFSKFMQKELHFFMDQDTLNFAFTNPLNSLPFRLAMENKDERSIEEFLKRVEETEPDVFVKMLRSDEPVFNLQLEETNLREKLDECLKNPIETKARLILLLRLFYEKVFKPYEGELKVIIAATVEKYEMKYKRNPGEFVKDFFRTELSDASLQDRVIYIHLSFFMQMGILRFLNNNSHRPGFVIMGIHADRLFGKQVMKARLKSFYKLLSDDKRFEILELISEKPRYVNELADLLSIAPSTVSHHMNYFLRASLVKPERDEHKLYYAFDKEKFYEMLDRTKKFITGE